MRSAVGGFEGFLSALRNALGEYSICRKGIDSLPKVLVQERSDRELAVDQKKKIISVPLAQLNASYA